MRTLPWIVLAVLALATNVAADPLSDPVNGTVGDAEGLLDDIAGGARDLAEGVGSVVAGAGEGVGRAASAVTQALASAAAFVAQTAISGAQALGVAGSFGALALAGGAEAAARALVSASTATGSFTAGAVIFTALAIGKGTAWVAGAAVQGAAELAAAAWGAIVAYIGLVSVLRPAAVPEPAFHAAAAAGGAATVSVGTWSGWQALRRWGVLGMPFAGWAGFSRLDDGQLLDHPMRRDIFNTIREHPGIHASHLAREVGAGWGTVTHHLDKLGRAGLVTTRRVNNQKCYFEQGGAVRRQDMAIAGALKGDTASQIAAYVASHPMTSQKAMAEALGISPALSSFHVKKLAHLGVLEKVRHGKETLLSTSESLHRLLASQQDGSLAGAIEAHRSGQLEYGS